MGEPADQSVSTLVPCMYRAIAAGSVSASHTASRDASMSTLVEAEYVWLMRPKIAGSLPVAKGRRRRLPEGAAALLFPAPQFTPVLRRGHRHRPSPRSQKQARPCWWGGSGRGTAAGNRTAPKGRGSGAVMGGSRAEAYQAALRRRSVTVSATWLTGPSVGSARMPA